jgi:hypothetical protein
MRVNGPGTVPPGNYCRRVARQLNQQGRPLPPFCFGRRRAGREIWAAFQSQQSRRGHPLQDHRRGRRALTS